MMMMIYNAFIVFIAASWRWRILSRLNTINVFIDPTTNLNRTRSSSNSMITLIIICLARSLLYRYERKLFKLFIWSVDCTLYIFTRITYAQHVRVQLCSLHAMMPSDACHTHIQLFQLIETQNLQKTHTMPHRHRPACT